MAGVNDPCNGGVALFLLRNEKNDTAKKNLLQDIIQQCANKKLKGIKKRNKKNGEPKIKRKMSWYNCCVKVNSKGKEFGYATKSGVCKVSNDKKKKYQVMVEKNGCEI